MYPAVAVLTGKNAVLLEVDGTVKYKHAYSQGNIVNSRKTDQKLSNT